MNAKLLLLVAVVSFSAACSDSNSPTSPAAASTPSTPSTPSTTANATVNAVTVSGTAPAVGATTPFTATAALSDTSSRPVTSDATWESSNTAVARIITAGMVTGVSAGEADISATYQNVTGRVHITVGGASSASVTMVTVTGTAPPVGITSFFSAVARLADGTTRDVTNVATWRSSDTSIATVGSTGHVTGVALGQADISATYQDATGSRTITVGPSTCVLSLSPTMVSIPGSGGTATIVVSVVFQGTTCTWSATSSASFVTITSGSSGNGAGATTISVSPSTVGPRSAIIEIGGHQVFVFQAAGNCVTSVTPATADYSAELRQGSVMVTATPDCPWTPTASSPFISFNPLAAARTGSGVFGFLVFGNLTGAPRSGSLTIGSQTSSVTQRAALGGNFLSFVSDPGDYVGQGWTLLHEAPTSTFTPGVDATRNSVSFQIAGSDGLRTMFWNLGMAAPSGQQLAPGTYTSAGRWPFQAPTAPGLSFYGNGAGCNDISGQFTVTEVVFGVGGSVQRLRATFEQHCERAGPALRGTIVYVQ